MPDALQLLGAFGCNVMGMGWLALAMDVHWRQVRSMHHSARTAVVLRVVGSMSLLSSLVLCLLADTATMAMLVWMMMLAVSAATIAFVLSSRPRILTALTKFGGVR